MTKKPTEDKSSFKLDKEKSSGKELIRQVYHAIDNNDIDRLKEILTEDINVNDTSGANNRHTPLTLACYHKNQEIIKLLINAGADVNNESKDGKTPLTIACDAYDSPPVDKLVKLLLDNGADPNLYKKGHDGPLQYAAMYNQLGAVKLLVENGADLNAKGAYGRTALIYAASSASSTEMVEYLIKKDADIKAKNKAGENALYEAITRDKENPGVVELLLKNGISPNCQTKSYGSVLHWAAFCGRVKTVEILIKKGAKIEAKDKFENTPIIKAMSNHKTEVVKLLFDLGANPLSQGPYGFSLLEYASELGDHKFVKKIVAKIENISGKSLGALNEAAKKGDIKMLKLLIGAGFDVNDKGAWGSETPLIKAAYYGKLEAVKYLLENAADIKAKDYRGNTALLHAAWGGHTKVVRELLKHGAEINERNNLNWNALMQACVEGHVVTAKLLLEMGSPTNEIDKEKGATALTLAKYSGSKELIQLLESYGAKERKVKMRKEKEPYYSIFECEICEYLPDKKDLARTEYPEHFEGLETIYSEVTHSDRYSDDTSMLKRCVNCGTFYFHYHSIDTEDAFISGPSITHNFQRINLEWLKSVLKELNKIEELNDFEKRYPQLIEEFKVYLLKKHDKIIDYHRNYVIESLTDFYVNENDWISLKNNLLLHPNADFVFKTAKDLIVMYGAGTWKRTFPFYTEYKSVKEEQQQKFKKFFEKHIPEFKKSIKRFESSDNEEIQKQYQSLIKSAEYYKLF